MDIMRAIIFSAIAVAVAVGASISLTYVGVDNGSGTLSPAPPANNTGSPPVQGGTDDRDAFTVLPDSDLPTISDAGLKVEKVAEGLALPTSMTFVDRDDILITQKDNGMVRLVSNGALQEKPILDVFVEKNSERGLLGVAVANATDGEEKTVFLYYTESSGDEVRNRIYKYDWDGSGNLTDGTIVLDLPGQPGPNHDGGKLEIGPDGMLYAVIGDLNRNGMLQNYRDGPE